jgi:MFS family permease
MKKINSNLILLLTGRTVSDMGTGIQMVIMPLYIIDIGGSAATLGLFAFLSLVPVLIVYPFAGVIGDRLNRKRIMIATDLCSAAVILTLAHGAYIGRMSLAVLLAVQVAVSMLNGLYDPATKGMLPQLVMPEKLTKANSSLASLRMLSALLSPVIGAALYVGLGVAWVFLANGVSFFLSGFSSLLIQYKHEKRSPEEDEKGFITDLAEGFRFISANQTIGRLCFLFLMIFALIQPIFTVVLPFFFKTSLAYTDAEYGYLQMIIILGALIGSILVAALFGAGKAVGRPLRIGCISLMVTMPAFSALLFPSVLSAIGKDSLQYFFALGGILCIMSVGVMFINIPVQTFIQTATPNEYMSRVFSIVGLISKGGMPFGALLYGIVLSRAPIGWSLLAASFLMVLISAVFLLLKPAVSDSE